jgi:DNA-directed RNA polymerase specialized sigma24 family protein
MPSLLRIIMLLHEGGALADGDVGEPLGVAVPAAYFRLKRARKELRSRIGRGCGRKVSIT